MDQGRWRGLPSERCLCFTETLEEGHDRGHDRDKVDMHTACFVKMMSSSSFPVDRVYVFSLEKEEDRKLPFPDTDPSRCRRPFAVFNKDDSIHY